MDFLPSSWLEILAFELPLLELVARGSAMYLGIIVLLRLMPRRAGGELSRMDLVFLLLVAEAATHALGNYSSLLDALVVVATLLGWNYVLNLLSFHVPLIERLVSAPHVQIVRDGRLLRRNMRGEFLTEEELMSYFRMEGIDSLDQVKAAYVEAEGRISVVPHKA